MPPQPAVFPDEVAIETSGFPTGSESRPSLLTSSITSPVVDSSRIMPPCGFWNRIFWNRLLRQPGLEGPAMRWYHQRVVSPSWFMQLLPHHQLSLPELLAPSASMLHALTWRGE